jgi:hypothetical protein
MFFEVVLPKQNRKKAGYNSTYNKLAVQCNVDTFEAIENWFFATIFLLKAANFL